MRSEHCASQLDAANWCSAREHLNSFQLIQAVAVFLVLHRSFAAWAVGGLLRESQQFSPIRSQTLMPSFVFLCSRQCSTEPPSQPRRPATRRGIFFREFRFPLLRFLRSRFSVTVMFLACYTDIESSRVDKNKKNVGLKKYSTYTLGAAQRTAPRGRPSRPPARYGAPCRAARTPAGWPRRSSR